MRVVLVTHYYPAHRGGVEIVAGEIAGRLAAEGGFEIEWHASDCDPAPGRANPHCQPAVASNFIESRFGLPYPLWSWTSLSRLVRAVRAADLVHLHDCLYMGNMVAFAAARIAGRPVLVTQHIGAVPYRSAALRVALAMANRLFGRMVLGHACRVAFVSGTTRRYFERIVRFRRPPVTIANGVDVRLFRPAEAERRQALRRELGVREGQPLLLFAGRFVEKKGLLLLRQLAGRLSDALWLFAGAGPLDPELWRAANVRVLRGRDQAGLAPLYQAADLLVLPSYGEGFPLVVQEAMACGTPALVDVEVARACPEAAGLLPSESIAGDDAAQRWENRIRALAAADGGAQARSRLAQFAQENWSWEICARRHAQAMRECVAGNSPR